jgi:hypothetical protein
VISMLRQVGVRSRLLQMQSSTFGIQHHECVPILGRGGVQHKREHNL